MITRIAPSAARQGVLVACGHDETGQRVLLDVVTTAGADARRTHGASA